MNGIGKKGTAPAGRALGPDRGRVAKAYLDRFSTKR
jgi:hypothetical protein